VDFSRGQRIWNKGNSDLEKWWQEEIDLLFKIGYINNQLRRNT